MRSLIVVPSLIRAGAETQAVDLANGLASMGHEVNLASFERFLDQEARVREEVRFHYVPRKTKFDLSLISRMAALMDRERIEIVLGVLQFGTLIASLASSKSGLRPPVVAAVHTTVARNIKQELQNRFLYRHMLRRRPAVVFVCENQRAHWIHKYPELERIAHVVHNGVDLAQFHRQDFLPAATRLRKKLGIPEDSFVFSCIAGFRPEKGHRLLIQAFGEVAADAYLILAGDGENRPMVEAQVESTGLTSRVRFLGNVSEVRPVIVASNGTVLASTAVETFSMAMLESMALEVPMVAPRIGGLAEAIIPGRTGSLFPIGDIGELGRCLRSMVADPSGTRKLGEAARTKVAQRFTMERMLAEYERILLSSR